VKLSKTILLFLALTVAAFAQNHSYSQADIEEGGQTYRKNCIGCHGGEGTSVSGIDLVRGKFRIAVSDDDILRIMLNGLPGTGMPATAMSQARATMVLAYLRNLRDAKVRKSIAASSGDALRGKALFDGTGGCAGCHRIKGVGGRSGPDLSDAGQILNSLEIETSILEPDAGYPFGSRPVRLENKAGSVVTGLLLNHDSYSVQLLDQEGSLRSIDRVGLKRFAPAQSWMPAYRGKLNPQELADLIAYLAKQKGAQ
jgi:putative heme-binding domain-containing protein